MESGMIAVDRWTEGSQLYFLTHLHADHTRGLSSTWARGPIFCSRITAKLFPFRFPDFNLSLLRVVEVGSWHTLSLVSLATGSPAVAEVMAIDAHHCPGSVMFLFRGEFGYLLYTGDFRWEITSEMANIGRSMLLNALNGSKVDVLYLDNTYCNPTYCFPSREVAAQQVIDIITSNPEHDIIIGIDTLGKEDLLLHISHVLKIKIWVWPERLRTMHLLGLPDIFTTKTSLTRIRAVPRYSFSIDTLKGLNAMRPTLGIMPSGLPWVMKPLEGEKSPSCSTFSDTFESRSKWPPNDGNRVDQNMRCVERFHQYIYSVPYSDHSCFPEIKEFVRLVQPLNMKGIVSLSSCYVDPVYYLSHLIRSNQPSHTTYSNLKREDVGKVKVKRESKMANSKA
ncbi:hypothetical protein Nepgr_009035 [Nepenthes gracilis]|uniref:Protein artemis n=1 Tax=Nepenthes gracilis TaxID=150966 RepID=A0AAD3SA70_NEPGR|nr:hypothetical protein Nepgr_009035 [Nepenthes gracilis]